MNHFARLGLEPRPWIDEMLLKHEFLARSAKAHPDKTAANKKADAERQFQELNQSYNILRNSRLRLLHLLELCGLPKQEPVQEVPAVALEFFAEVAAVTKKADELLKEKAGASSPMLRVQLMEKALHQVESIRELQDRIRKQIESIEASLLALSYVWSATPPDELLQHARDAAAALGFLERWMAQLQERIGALTF